MMQLQLEGSSSSSHSYVQQALPEPGVGLLWREAIFYIVAKMFVGCGDCAGTVQLNTLQVADK